MPDIANRVPVEPRSAVTQYLTPAGLSDVPPADPISAPIPAPDKPTADKSATTKPQE